MSGVAIVQCHQAAVWVRRITKKFSSLGAVTLIGPELDNLCRRARPEEITRYGGLEWVIESQGLPNLIHELIHALFLGHLDDDHGFDYGEIPLDLARRDHRELLWEELACCGLSATSCAPLIADPGFERAWFAEQFEIQGVFHGFDDDLAAFRAHIDAHLREPANRAGLERTVAWARVALAEVLEPSDASVVPDCEIPRLWQDYRAHAGLAHVE